MKKIILTLTFGVICGSTLAQNNAIYKAQTLTEKGDLQGAAAVFEEALKNPKTTKFAEMYHKAAEVNAQIFNPELIKASQGVPFDTLLFVNSLDKMVDYYTRSHEADIKPDEKGRVKSKFVAANHGRMLSMLDYYNYAAIFMNQNGNIEKSTELFEKYLALPKNPIFSSHETDSIYASKKTAYSQTAVNLALLSYNGKKWDKAITYADQALSSDTLSMRDLYIIKMQSYVEKGDSVMWLKTLTEAVSRTESANFMQNLLYYYVSHNDLAAAEKMASDMVAASPNNKIAWYMKGCVELTMKKDYQAAKESFEKALSYDPDFLEANVNMASAYINQIVADKLAGKFKYVGTNKAVYKKDEAAYNKELSTIKSYYQKALPYMEKARALAPNQPKVWAYTLQMIYENLQMKAEKAEIDAVIEGI